MAEVHTIYRKNTWRNLVDGLQQGTSFTSRPCAVAAGRSVAAEIGAELVLHDVDGRVLAREEYAVPTEIPALGALRYTA